jgi:hypothetical protein
MPVTVKSLAAVIPPAPLIVKLFTPPWKIDAGSVIADAFINDKVAPALPASIFPLARAGEFPDMVNVFAARVKVPLVNSRVPATLAEPPKLMPVALFRVRLLSSTPGRVVVALLPPIMIFEELPPDSVPATVVMDPFSVKVFAPIENAPDVKVKELVIIKSPFPVRPCILFNPIA